MESACSRMPQDEAYPIADLFSNAQQGFAAIADARDGWAGEWNGERNSVSPASGIRHDKLGFTPSSLCRSYLIKPEDYRRQLLKPWGISCFSIDLFLIGPRLRLATSQMSKNLRYRLHLLHTNNTHTTLQTPLLPSKIRF